MVKLSDYELKVLKECNGEVQDGIIWGAAMSITIEFLQRLGFITIGSPTIITDKGKEYLKSNG